MTRMIVFLFFVFGGFGLWGQQQEDRDAQERKDRRATIEAGWKAERERVARESAAVQEQQQKALEESLARQETTLAESLTRQQTALDASLARQNSNWGGGGSRGALYHMPQDGAVAIGERVSPANDILQTGVDCVDKLTEKLGYKDAQAYCRDITREAMKTSGNVSRSARKAVKAPPILIPRYGW